MKLGQSKRALVAGLLWVGAGGLLVVRGTFPYWFSALEDSALKGLAVLAAALLVGGGKGWFVLRRSAQRMLDRIEANPGPQPIWLIYPPAFWLLIPIMIGMGIGLRMIAGEDHPWLVALVYIGIGVALLVSSIPYFAAARSFSARLREGR